MSRGRRTGGGFLEVVVAVGLVATVLVPIIVSFTAETRSTDHTNRRIVATVLTNACLERYRGESFASLVRLFGPSSGGGRDAIARDPILHGELIGIAMADAAEYVLDGHFEEAIPGKVGLLRFTCRFPTRMRGKIAALSASKVVLDYARIGWGREEPLLAPR